MYSCVLLCCKSLYIIVVNFMGIKVSLILLSFLSMIIYVVLYTWCLRYNICSTWVLDINLFQLKWKCSSLWLVHAWFIEISLICNMYLYYYELWIQSKLKFYKRNLLHKALFMLHNVNNIHRPFHHASKCVIV